jgi:hypothetical protein
MMWRGESLVVVGSIILGSLLLLLLFQGRDLLGVRIFITTQR